MAEERTVILRLDSGEPLQATVATAFDGEALMDVADVVYDELLAKPDNVTNDAVLKELQARGYIRIIGPAPEIIDIML
jgi:hypothetical protein